jgi:hypothetical protein
MSHLVGWPLTYIYLFGAGEGAQASLILDKGFTTEPFSFTPVLCLLRELGCLPGLSEAHLAS